MFLIYNFHLQENLANDNEKEKLILQVQKILGRSLNDEDSYNIATYGMEAFCLTSLTTLNESSLMRNWKRINNLYNLFLIKDSVKIDQVMIEIQKANYYWEHLKYSNYSASIDIIFNILKKIDKSNSDFLMLLNNLCPFLKKSIEKSFEFL